VGEAAAGQRVEREGGRRPQEDVVETRGFLLLQGTGEVAAGDLLVDGVGRAVLVVASRRRTTG
jgi:hypothetical protein